MTAAPDGRSAPSAAPFEGSALLQRLPGTRAFDLELVEARMLTPAMRRLTFTAEGLETLAAAPGQDLMVAVPGADARHSRRRYTVRRLRAGVPSVSLDIVVHGDGPGARWAATARAGDRVEAIGPRGRIAIDSHARWHLFAGDESALPATLAMIEALPRDAVALAVVEVAGPEEEQPAHDARCELAMRWQHRQGPPGTGTALADALRGLELPVGPGHVYLAGELRQVAAARAVLVERGVPPEAIDHKAYWRRGAANAAHGEPERPAGDRDPA